MNKPITPLVADPDIGPLDEHGQQIWSPEEEASIGRVVADPEHDRKIAEARSQIARGECYTTDEVKSYLAEAKRGWRDERGLR